MKKKLLVTNEAKADLRGIRKYIEEDNARKAREFVADLTAKIAWIAEVDFTGSPRDNLFKGLRAHPYRGRCIYFISEPDRIVILGILHQARDVTSDDFEDRIPL